MNGDGAGADAVGAGDGGTGGSDGSSGGQFLWGHTVGFVLAEVDESKEKTDRASAL